MPKTLRCLGISHKTASVKIREKFYVADNDKDDLVNQLCNTFPDISGVLLLVTCNRTEVYFESEKSTASELLRFLVPYLIGEETTEYDSLFTLNESTENSVNHLLEVSSGLLSKVMGDAEIICQIKKAYQTCMANNLQGSILERAMQTVFRSHKKMRNETNFRDGTTSVAYKAMKTIVDAYGKEIAKKKKVLFIGAGDIVEQLFKYNTKFGFENIYISNRTKSRAMALVNQYHGTWYDWNLVADNNFQDFDIVISAVSNRHHLIKQVNDRTTKRLFIDLALPSNIDASLNNNDLTLFYDLDTISALLEANKEKRLASIKEVHKIKEEELAAFLKWYEDAPFRMLLSDYKKVLKEKIKTHFIAQEKSYDPSEIKIISNRIMRTFAKHPNRKVTTNGMDVLIEQHESLYLTH